MQAWAATSGGCFITHARPAAAAPATAATAAGAEVNARVAPAATSIDLLELHESRARLDVDADATAAHVSGGPMARSDALEEAEGKAVFAAFDAEFDAAQLPSGFARWTDVAKAGRGAWDLVRWAKVKSVQRAIEKATRSYKKVR